MDGQPKKLYAPDFFQLAGRVGWGGVGWGVGGHVSRIENGLVQFAPHHEKTCISYLRKQGCRSAAGIAQRIRASTGWTIILYNRVFVVDLGFNVPPIAKVIQRQISSERLDRPGIKLTIPG